MENTELKKILSELSDHVTKGMESNLTIRAIRDTIARYPHDAIERITLNTLLDRLDAQASEFSAIWWRLRKIEKLDENEKEAPDAE